MYARMITDWDDAYANIPNVPNGEAYPPRWEKDAAAFRASLNDPSRAGLQLSYGPNPRNNFDLFHPATGKSNGVVIFIHGGYWMRFDNRTFSHFASGLLDRGFDVALPAYQLCPEVSIREITAGIGAAIETIAERSTGPIRLIGHSAGGHLATRMVCTNTPLSAPTVARIVHTISLSGVHDLRPLLKTQLNETLRLTDVDADEESPALLKPVAGTRLTCWVGANERAEFIRQNALLANIWLGLGASTQCVEQPDRHHFTVVDGLLQAKSPLINCLLGP